MLASRWGLNGDLALGRLVVLGWSVGPLAFFCLVGLTSHLAWPSVGDDFRTIFYPLTLWTLRLKIVEVLRAGADWFAELPCEGERFANPWNLSLSRCLCLYLPFYLRGSMASNLPYNPFSMASRLPYNPLTINPNQSQQLRWQKYSPYF